MISIIEIILFKVWVLFVCSFPCNKASMTKGRVSSFWPVTLSNLDLLSNPV